MEAIQKDSKKEVDEQREKDVLTLCAKVLQAAPSTYYNPNGADESTCPFCFESVYYANADIKDIKHAPDCAYLIAKDLSTNLI